MQISKEQMKIILNNAPTGSDPKRIVEKLIERGHDIEGLDSQITGTYRNQKRIEAESVGNRFEEKPKSFWQKARDFTVGVIGGGKLAEGAGMAIAAPEVQEKIDVARQNITNTQTQLLARIKEKEARGEDTTRLRTALEITQQELGGVADVSTDFTEALPTNKEVIGSAARLATTAATPFIAGKAAQATGAGQAITTAGGALRGAGAGAITGATTGVVQGAGLAAEQNASAGEIATAGVTGGVAGGVFGALLGGVSGAISGKAKGAAIRKENFAADLASPKLTTKERVSALRQGRIEDPTLFNKASVKLTEREKEIGNAIADVVDEKASLGQNIDAIRNKINTTDTGVRQFLQSNKVPFNKNQLTKQLMGKKDDLELVFASDATAEKTYDAVVKAFLKEVKKGDTIGLFDARQNFDQLPAVQKLLQSQALGENSRKEIVLAVRRAANDYIADQIPAGSVYKGLMQQQSYALEALDNIAEKNASIIGKSGLQLLLKEYPALNYLATGAAGATIGITASKILSGGGMSE